MTPTELARPGEAHSISAEHIFLDIVNYSTGRSVEAQTDMISVLNRPVRETVREFNIPEDQLVYLPTGDGLCVVIWSVDVPYDLHARIPCALLARLHAYNMSSTDEMRKFKIRIGLNMNSDNLVTDINGQRNVAGAGINLAQRIMNEADGNQIMVSDSVYEVLRHREKYIRFFRSFAATTKHRQEIRIHQYIKPETGLDISIPVKFREAQVPELRLSRLAAYYFAHAMQNRDFMRQNIRGDLASSFSWVVLLYMLADDSAEASTASDLEPHEPNAWGPGKPIAERLAHYRSIEYWVSCKFAGHISSSHLAQFGQFFEDEEYPNDRLFISEIGQQKLKRDWPEIWKEFGFDN